MISEFASSKVKDEVAIVKNQLQAKQLQLDILLQITEAINANIKKGALLKMYTDILHNYMQVEKLAFLTKEKQSWTCLYHFGISGEIPTLSDANLENYIEEQVINKKESNEWLRVFEIIIPVHHKEDAIAYVLLSGRGTKIQDWSENLPYVVTVTNIVATAIENKRLFKKQLEEERLRKEMHLGTEMQLMLVPSILPNIGLQQLDSIYKPHSSIGGDYFDYIPLDKDRFAFCIADISGKGVAAALLMANFQGYLHSMIHKTNDLKTLVEELNGAVLKTTKGDRFITFFIGVFDRSSKMLNYINAGHTPPVMIMNNQIVRLDEGCTILGIFPKLPHIQPGAIELSTDALILSFTDGLTDVFNENNDYFNDDIVEQFALANSNLSAKDFNISLMEQVDLFRGNAAYPDDFTVLTCKIFI